jgi:hypothetical protein
MVGRGDPMSNLRRIREVNWAEIELTRRLLRQPTPQEGIQHFLEVQAMLEPQYRATETLFRPQREAHLTELQSRLARFQAARDRAMDMNKLIESVLDLQKRLDEAGIPSVLIGGLAVSAWGEPRGTRDVDLKVLLKREDAQRLLDLLGADFVPLHADPFAVRRNGFCLCIINWCPNRSVIGRHRRTKPRSAVGQSSLIWAGGARVFTRRLHRL